MKEIRFIVVVEFNGNRITTDCFDDLKQAIEICDSYYESYGRTYKNVKAFVVTAIYYRGWIK